MPRPHPLVRSLPALAITLASGVALRGAHGQGCPVSLSAPSTVNAAAGVYSVALGDLNADGIEDLVTANSTANTILYWLGQASGTFLPSQLIVSSGTPTRAIVTNVSGGPRGDLVAANFNAGTVTVWPDVQQTIPLPPAPFSVAAGPSPFWVHAADVNGDSRTDLVVSNFGASTVNVLLSRADGTFETRRSFTTPSPSFCVCTGDFNLDGKPDIATANYNTATVSVLPGFGDGNFGPAQSFACQQSPRGVCSADVNVDGRPDLVVANLVSSTVTVLLGNGDGTFLPGEHYATASGPSGVVATDLNNDGLPDLAVATGDTGVVSVLTGIGGGRFKSAVSFAAGSQPTSLVCGDLNRDGVTDLAVSNYGGQMTRLYNQTPMVQFTQQPRSLRLWPGVGGSLSAMVQGGTGLAFRWYKDEQPVVEGFGVTGSTSPTLNFSPEVPATVADGVYRLEVSNSCGAVRSSRVYVSKPACAVDIDNSGAATVNDLYAFLAAWFVSCP